jgi:hypothetical protein
VVGNPRAPTIASSAPALPILEVSTVLNVKLFYQAARRVMVKASIKLKTVLYEGASDDDENGGNSLWLTTRMKIG